MQQAVPRIKVHSKALQIAHLTYILERALPLLLKEGTEDVNGVETEEDDKQAEHQAASRAMSKTPGEHQFWPQWVDWNQPTITPITSAAVCRLVADHTYEAEFFIPSHIPPYQPSAQPPFGGAASNQAPPPPLPIEGGNRERPWNQGGTVNGMERRLTTVGWRLHWRYTEAHVVHKSRGL